MPPAELRRLGGPSDPLAFDNPDRLPIYLHFGLPDRQYESVFDFGCGCGRVARQLLLQRPRPRRYVGIDINRDVIDWCTQHLSPIDPGFRFYHHDVYSPGYAPRNALRLSERFPVPDEAFSLVIAHSVFTHLTRPQTEFYLGEVARILERDGVAFTSWFFFDRDSFPFLTEGPFSLYTSETDFSQAVIFDRRWFLDTLGRIGLRVRSTHPPDIPGHQWILFIERRIGDGVDRFPLGTDGAEWLCGATVKASTGSAVGPVERRQSDAAVSPTGAPARPPQPELFGVLALYDAMKRSKTWRLGRAITAPWRLFRKFLSGGYDDVHGD